MVVIIWWLDLQLPVESVPIATKVVSSNPVHGEVYSIQLYVIKFVSDFLQVDGFLLALRFPPPIKLTTTINNNGVKQRFLACFLKILEKKRKKMERTTPRPVLI